MLTGWGARSRAALPDTSLTPAPAGSQPVVGAEKIVAPARIVVRRALRIVLFRFVNMTVLLANGRVLRPFSHFRPPIAAYRKAIENRPPRSRGFCVFGD